MNTVQKFQQRFEHYCRLQDLLTSDDKILVAVSGGVDSVVLLDLLASFQVKYRLQLKIVHLNHQLRGKELMQMKYLPISWSSDTGSR